MTTWQELTVPGLVTSVVTGGALLFQNWRNGVREDGRRADDARERQKDRDHALDMAAQDAKRQLDERWRDERRAAYVSLLELSETVLSASEQFGFMVQVVGDDEAAAEYAAKVDEESDETVSSAVSLIALLGSSECRNCAEVLGHRVGDVVRMVWMAHELSPPGDKDRPRRMQSVQAANGKAREARDLFLDAVRKDLGTA